MARVFSDRIITSIDVGTTKICVLIAHQLDDQYVEIIGVGKANSYGLRKGVVIDIPKTIHAISLAVQEAELMAGVKIERAYVGISGGHIQSLNSHGVVPIKKGEIRATDVATVLAAAQAIPIPEEQHILHVLPQYFVIDSRDQVHDPVGMHGIRLEVQAHIITGAIASVQNLIKCCEMAGLTVADIILEQLASASAVLSEDERELGVAMLDIGGGTSDLAIYQHGSIRHTMVLPVAGSHFTNDIAVGLRTTLQDAERIKKEYGIACMDVLDHDILFEVDLVQGHQKQIVSSSDIMRIIQPRAQELFLLIYHEIIKRKLTHFIATGLVLTGGGSLLKGMKEVAEKIFDMPVRVGSPHIAFTLPESLHHPMYATGYGLLLYALKMHQNQVTLRTEGPLLKRVFERMKSWVSDFF
jgi:cell division protein FtsA